MVFFFFRPFGGKALSSIVSTLPTIELLLSILLGLSQSLPLPTQATFYVSHCIDWSHRVTIDLLCIALYVYLKVWNRFLSRDTVFWASLSFGIMPQPTLSAIFIVDFQHLAWKLNCYFLFLQDRKYFHSALPATLKKRDKLSTNWEGHSRRGDGAEGKGKRLGGLV